MTSLLHADKQRPGSSPIHSDTVDRSKQGEIDLWKKMVCVRFDLFLTQVQFLRLDKFCS